LDQNCSVYEDPDHLFPTVTHCCHSIMLLKRHIFLITTRCYVVKMTYSCTKYKNVQKP